MLLHQGGSPRTSYRFDNSFIEVLKRFVSRRGKPSDIYSDNGSNFVGANRALKELGNFLHNHAKILTEKICNSGIQWHFIPANSPHFGGLWEAGIKSSKAHLKRILFNTHVTFEKLLTVLTQIESILNSRPLCPLSSDANDLECLTPGHLLIGRSVTSIPEADVTHQPINRLEYHQHLQQLVQHFWQRWRKEYISELHQRTKWHRNQPNLDVGRLVLLKDDNLSPLHWLMGRIVAVHPGEDGVVRVATIKTSTGTFRRAVTKLCVLPGQD